MSIVKTIGFQANIRSSEGAGTTTLTISDNPRQVFNLSASRTVVLPTTEVKAGDIWILENRSTSFDLVVQASSGNAITRANGAATDATIQGGYVILQALQDAPTAVTHWRVTDLHDFGSYAVTGTNSATGTLWFNRRINMVTLEAAVSHSSAGGTTLGAGTLLVRHRPPTFRNNIMIITGNPQYITRVETAADGSVGISNQLVQASPGSPSVTSGWFNITHQVA